MLELLEELERAAQAAIAQRQLLLVVDNEAEEDVVVPVVAPAVVKESKNERNARIFAEFKNSYTREEQRVIGEHWLKTDSYACISIFCMLHVTYKDYATLK